jgi:hypothetical protein
MELLCGGAATPESALSHGLRGRLLDFQHHLPWTSSTTFTSTTASLVVSHGSTSSNSSSTTANLVPCSLTLSYAPSKNLLSIRQFTTDNCVSVEFDLIHCDLLTSLVLIVSYYIRLQILFGRYG